MTYRETMSAKAFQRELDEQEEREREERDRPIRAMEKQLLDTHKKLIAVQRENVQKMKDPEIFVSSELANARMSQEAAATFNRSAIRAFIEETPDYAPFRTPENAEIILDYLSRNGIFIADAPMFRAAFYRLRDLGLLTAREAPEPESIPEPEPTPVQPSAPTTYTGRDFLTGLDREFSEREINRMSSLEFSRAFKVTKDLREIFSK